VTAVRTQAIVLRRTNYGEADRIVQVLTPLGKRSVVARGVRREKSKLAGGIELFGVSDIVINQGKSELGILTSARLTRFYRHILEEYDRLQFGYEVIKHIDRAADTMDEPEWFDILDEVLAGLDRRDIPLQLVQTWFYLRYAALMGGELSLTRDVDGNPLSPDVMYQYDVGEKGLRESDRGDISADHIKYLRLVSAKSLMVVAQVGGVEGILPQCWYVARQHAAI
jgi:DNA repair protein RecO (recombination protein O)